MKFKSMQDILEFAAIKEQSSILFYRGLLGHVKDTNTAAILEAMARQEEKHAEAVKFELIKLGRTVSDVTAEERAADEDEIALEVDAKAGEMSAIDFLRLGIQKEKASFDLYAQLMVLATEPEARKMFLELAEEEMRHVISLEREIEILTQPRQR